MTNWAIWGTTIAAIFVAAVIGFSQVDLTQTVQAAPPSGLTEKVSVTTQLTNPGGGPAGVTVLLDTTGSGFLSTVHVAATLPAAGGAACSGFPAPDGAMTIVAGIAGVTIPTGIVIIDGTSGADNTSFPGDAAGSCVYHGTAIAPSPGTITDVAILNGIIAGQVWKPFPPGTIVTVTGTYE